MTRVAVVIPAYGRQELTQAVVRQLRAESDLQTTIVVDNAGDYDTVASEIVLRPGENLGWLRGTNLGIRHALDDESFSHVCLLNNDVLLADGFIAGLVAACAPGVGVVAPSYDDSFAVQSAYYTGPAANFTPQTVDVEAEVVDGTCMLLPREVVERVGLLDERNFGRYGWGACDDLCLRMKCAGLLVLVTRRSYLEHRRGSTASMVLKDYHRRAMAEMYFGMRRKYGRRWPERFPSGTFDRHLAPQMFRRQLKVRVMDRTGILRWMKQW